MLKKITDRVFYMPAVKETDRPILGLICGDKYSLIVDSGNSPKHAKEFLSELGTINVAPPKYLVITHYHEDHVFGIKDMNLITISHEKTIEKLNELKGYKWDDASLDEYVKQGIFNDFEVYCIKQEVTDRDKFTLGDIDITYNDSMEIDLGGITCIIKSVGGDHTDDSSVIYVPEEKVLFLGDCVYGRSYNGVYGFTKERFYSMLDKIEKFDAEHFLISHKEPFNKEEMDDFWNQLKNAERAVGKDTSIEEAARRFSDIFGKEPSEDEAFYIKCFADVNRVL